MQKRLHPAVAAGLLVCGWQGSVVCVLQIEDGVVCYFRHCLQRADIKQAAIESVLDANAICSRDVVT